MIYLLAIFYLFLSQIVVCCAPLIYAPQLDNLEIVKQSLQDLQFQNVVFSSFLDATKSSTINRRGILVVKPEALGTVIICHGYLGCKRDAIALKHLFPQYNVFAFDFRAHGDDVEGQFSTIGRDEAYDVIGAVDFIRSRPDMAKLPIIAFGYSMGAVSAIQAQAQEGSLFDAMILDCPYDSTDQAMRRGLAAKMKFSLFGKTYDLPGQNFVLNHMYDEFAQKITSYLFQKITQLDSKKVATKFVQVMPIESIKKISIPCFFIHCENDKKVPVIAVESLYHNKPGFKRLWITQGKNHFGSYQNNPELYWYKVNKFLTKLRNMPIENRQPAKICDHRTYVTMNNNRIKIIPIEIKNQAGLQTAKHRQMKLPMKDGIVVVDQ